MRRRQFLKSTIASSIALLSAGSLSAKSLKLRALIKGQPLTNFTPITVNDGKAVLNIEQTEIVLSKDGSPTEVWNYSSGYGNMFDVFEGDNLEITMNNQLPEATTVHWHGIDVPADQDGDAHGVFDTETTRTVNFSIPQASAGSYWFHPHPHMRTAFQVAQGLAAPFIVRSKDDPIAALGIRDIPLFFTAPMLDGNLQIAEQTMSEQMNGRSGNVVLVNGQYLPVLDAKNGETLRLRLFNASNGRFLRLSFSDSEIVQIGTDGGLLVSPLSPASTILLAPAERAEVLVRFEAETTLTALTYEKGFMGGMMMGGTPAESKDVDVMSVQVSGDTIAPIDIPTTLRAIEQFGDAVVTRQFTLSENMGMSVSGMTMDFMINGKTFDMNRIDFTAKQGEIEMWEIINKTDMDHPFHIHGNQFQIVSITENCEETPFPFLCWKDTVNTKKGQTVRLKLQQNQVGNRMFHCHILEHEDLGMMGQYEVVA